MDKKRIRNLAISAAMIFSVATIGVMSSMAILTGSDRAVNTFTIGEVVVHLDEPGWGVDKGKNMTPGTTLIKDPTVTSEKTSQDSYMRVRMVILDSDTGKPIKDPARYEAILDTIYYDEDEVLEEGKEYDSFDLQPFTMTNLEKFKTPASIGGANLQSVPDYLYFEYKGIFHPEDEVVLFNRIVIPSDYSEDELRLLGKYRIRLSAEAIQAEGFANADDAFAALSDDYDDILPAKKKTMN